MAVISPERSAAANHLESSDVIEALGIAGARNVRLGDGAHRVLDPRGLYPLGCTLGFDNYGAVVRQHLKAVVRPPEDILLGIVQAEVRGRVGIFVSRLAIDGGQQAELQTVLSPERILRIHPDMGEGRVSDWTTGITLVPEVGYAAVLHRGVEGTDIYAAPTEGTIPLFLPDHTLWAPGPTTVSRAFCG